MGISALVAVRLEGPVQADAEARLQLYLSLDNYATHKHPDVTKWLARHQRFHLHFTPTSSRPHRTQLRRGIFGSVPDLIASIETYLAVHNDDPKPYVWAATAEDILAKVQRARTKLDALVNQN